MIPDREGFHYLAVKKTASAIKKITSTDHSNFYCLNCLHSFAIEIKREHYQKICEKKDFRNVLMSSEETISLELNQHQKSDKVLCYYLCRS